MDVFIEISQIPSLTEPLKSNLGSKEKSNLSLQEIILSQKKNKSFRFIMESISGSIISILAFGKWRD